MSDMCFSTDLVINSIEPELEATCQDTLQPEIK